MWLSLCFIIIIQIFEFITYIYMKIINVIEVMQTEAKVVKKTISADLKKRQITHVQAAERLGMGKQTFSNLLYKSAYFTEAMALRFRQAFDYSVPYLMCGEGGLYDSEPVHAVDVNKREKDQYDTAMSVLRDNALITKLSLETLIKNLRSAGLYEQAHGDILVILMQRHLILYNAIDPSNDSDGFPHFSFVYDNPTRLLLHSLENNLDSMILALGGPSIIEATI